MNCQNFGERTARVKLELTDFSSIVVHRLGNGKFEELLDPIFV